MSGALNSVMGGIGGGSGGGLLGAIGGIVGGIFGGPLGSMIGQAVGNMLNQAISEGTNQSMDTLVSKHGMPKFIADEVKSNVAGTLAGLNKHVGDEATNIAKDNFGSAINEFKQDFAADLTAKVLVAIGKKAAGGDSATGAAGKGGTAGGGWLQAIAAAMGEALGDKAAQMVSLSQDMTELNKTSVSNADQIAALSKKAAGGDKTAQGELDALKAKDQANAKEFNMKMTQFQATSQEYSMLNNVFSTAIKALGESLSSMARKQ